MLLQVFLYKAKKEDIEDVIAQGLIQQITVVLKQAMEQKSPGLCRQAISVLSMILGERPHTQLLASSEAFALVRALAKRKDLGLQVHLQAQALVLTVNLLKNRTTELAGVPLKNCCSTLFALCNAPVNSSDFDMLIRQTTHAAYQFAPCLPAFTTGVQHQKQFRLPHQIALTASLSVGSAVDLALCGMVLAAAILAVHWLTRATSRHRITAAP